MGREIKFDISQLKSQVLQGLAYGIDSDSRKKYHDGKIDEKELEKLQKLLNGTPRLAVEVENETDDVKALFGYASPSSASQAANKGTDVVAAAEEAAKKDESKDASSVVADSKPAEGESKTNKTPYETVVDKYYEYRGIDMITREPVEGAQEMSPQAAYEAVEKDFKGDKTYKKALKNLRKYSIDTESKLVVMDAIAQSDATKSKDVKKDAKEILEQKFGKDGKLTDKHLKKALNGKGHSFWANTFNWLSGRDSGMKKYRKAQAYGNRAENIAAEPQTKEAMTKAIGKRSPLFTVGEDGLMAIEKLEYPYVNADEKGNRPKLVVQKDGKYDISKLSEFISKQIGADNKMSRQENDADSELESIRTEFRKQGLNLTKRDTKQLVEFCGYKVEGKNLIKTVVDGTIGAGAGALGTSVALFTQAPQIFSSAPKNHVTFDLDFKFVGKTAIESLQFDEEFKKKYVETGVASIVETATGIKIHIDHTEVHPFTEIAKKHIGLNALKAAGIGALTGIAAGLLEYGPSEKNVFSTRFKTESRSDCDEPEYKMTYDEFCGYVDARKELNDLQKLALKQIAYAYIEDDGSWDGKSFKDYLNEKAGYDSNLNEIELLKAVQDAPECLKQKKPSKPDPAPNPTPQQNNPPQPPQGDNCPECQAKPFKAQPKEVKFRSWPDLVNGYSCLSKYNKSIKVRNGYVSLNNRMVKVIQAMDISNVKTPAEFEKFYNIETIAAFAKEAILHGLNSAKKKYPEFPINDETYNNVVHKWKSGVIGNVVIPDLYDPKAPEGDDGKCSWNKQKDVPLAPPSGKGNGGRLAKQTKEGYIKSCDNGKTWEPCTKEEYEAINKK